MSKERKRMLVMRFSALGDVCMTIPVVYSVARRYPELHITMLTRPFFSKLFINAPKNIEVVGIDFKEQYKGTGGFWRLLRRLRRFRPGFVADLHNVGRTWAIDSYFRLHGVRVAMVDKNRSARREALRSRSEQKSFIARYVDVFTRLGYPVEPDFHSIFGAGKPQSPIAVEHPAVGVAPFARYFNKTYPADLMRQVVGILADSGVHVYLLGGRGEEAAELSRWADGIPHVESVAGRLAIDDEMALMANLDAVVSMDSANQHLASLCGVPVVSIWGSTAPECGFTPYGQPRANSICADVECQPCSVAGGPECPLGTLVCMRSIDPRAVFEKVSDILNGAGK